MEQVPRLLKLFVEIADNPRVSTVARESLVVFHHCKQAVCYAMWLNSLEPWIDFLEIFQNEVSVLLQIVAIILDAVDERLFSVVFWSIGQTKKEVFDYIIALLFLLEKTLRNSPVFFHANFVGYIVNAFQPGPFF